MYIKQASFNSTKKKEISTLATIGKSSSLLKAIPSIGENASKNGTSIIKTTKK